MHIICVYNDVISLVIQYYEVQLYVVGSLHVYKNDVPS